MLYNFILLLPCFTCFFWGVTLLFLWKNNHKSRNIWVATILVMGISTAIWSVYFFGIKDYILFYKLEVVEAFTTLLLFPLLYFGFKSLTNEQAFDWKDYIWFIPAPVVGISLLLLYVWMGNEQAIMYITEIVENRGHIDTFTNPAFLIHNIISIHLYRILILVQIAYLLIYATICLVRYKKWLNSLFSDLENKSLDNLYALLIGLYMILLLSLITYKGRFYYNGDSLFIQLLMLIWAALIYFMGYNLSHLEYTAETLVSDLKLADREATEEGYGESTITDANARKKVSKSLLPDFNRVINEEKIFLQKNLRLDDLARTMRTNRTYISRLINDEFNCTFSDYINKKRIEHAQKLIQDNPEMTQEQLAALSGFLHASSFSRTFKKQAGITFREWMESNKGINE